MRNKNNADKIVTSLKDVRISSDPAWQSEFLSKMRQLSQPDVTNSPVPRTSGHSLFNFLQLFKMGIQTKVATIAIASILTLGAGGVAVSASDVATPGSTFYFLDTFGEDLSRITTLDPIARADLEVAILEERLAEISALQLANADPAQIELALGELTKQQEKVQERIREMTQVQLESPDKEQERSNVNSRYEQSLQSQQKKLSELESEHKGNSEVEDSINEAQKKQLEAEIEMEKNSSQESNSGTTENQEQNQYQEENKNDDNGSDDRGRDND